MPQPLPSDPLRNERRPTSPPPPPKKYPPSQDATALLDRIGRLERANEQLRGRLREYQQLLVNADNVTRERFEYYGLCDCLDNRGGPYPSQWGHDLIKAAKAEGVRVQRSATYPRDANAADG